MFSYKNIFSANNAYFLKNIYFFKKKLFFFTLVLQQMNNHNRVVPKDLWMVFKFLKDHSFQWQRLLFGCFEVFEYSIDQVTLTVSQTKTSTVFVFFFYSVVFGSKSNMTRILMLLIFFDNFKNLILIQKSLRKLN